MQKKRVIIADVDTEVRQRLACEIDNSQYLTVAAQTDNGERLLELCAQCDIVVMDLILMSMDGMEVLDQLSTWQNKPLVIVLSSFPVERIARLSIAQGVDYLMLKPCRTEAVVKRILQMARIDEEPTQQSVSYSLKAKLAPVFHEIGIPSHIKGYQYLRDAIIFAVEEPDIIGGVTKQLYPKIAKAYATSASGVERAIRHAIEIAWSRGDLDTLQHYFGYSVSNTKGKPTNSEFIALIADQLQLQLRGADVMDF